ncbi:MAG: LPXTG cell wall anchor domain-containing protein [Thaumarchaeota archaeon]|nr:LPXTG cell wall anchor domain-containing protein [Nitrososphaerota archaeon]
MDKRVFLLGVSMLAIGGISWFYFNSTMPVATSGMTEEETNAFDQAEVVNTGLQNIAGMAAGIGFFIALISVGLRRRKKGEAGKSITQKPAQT